MIFYMTGNHQFLAKTASSIVQSIVKRKLVYDAIILLLTSQYITADFGTGEQTWKVVRGNGQGSIASGVISDAAMYVCAEKDFILNPLVKRAHQLAYYGRLKDDVYMVLKRFDGNIPLLGMSWIKHRDANKRQFQAHHWNVSSSEMSFFGRLHIQRRLIDADLYY